MSQSHCHSLKSSYSVPPLSAIVHGSNPVSFEDGFFLPSSCHGRTWLLDNFQEACSETTSSQVPNCERELCTEDSGVQRACLHRVTQTTCSSFRPHAKTTCKPESSSAVLKCVSQPCQSGSSQRKGLVIQNCQPVSYAAKCCPPKTYVSKSCRALAYESSQCQTQSPESSSCKPLVVTTGPQFLEASNNYEPTCCVTGGLQLPSK